MNTKSLFIMFTWIILAICGCKYRANNPVSEENSRQPQSSQSSGRLDVYFIDTLSQTQAEEFIISLNLSVIDFFNYNLRSPHRGLVGVPIGQENKWIDSLLTYTEVVSVSPLVLVSN